ncbi:MAG: glycosyltransferase family 4 protein [Armatimonadetes bacterium]|nr:glycosyltransferase family 4 protein [Armatimonadota bacterium]
MRIGFITDSYHPRISGVVISIALLAAQLRLRGHDVHVVAPRVVGYEDDEPHVHRLPSLTVPAYPDFPIFRPDPRPFVEFAVRQRLDILHAHSPFLSGLLAEAASRRTGAKLFFSHHTRYSEYVHYLPWIPAKVARWLVNRRVRTFCARVDRVIAPSASVHRLLVADGVSAPIEVIPTGSVDLETIARLAPHARADAGIPPGVPLVLTASRLTPEKSAEDVLRAVAEMDRRTWLIVLGGGPLARPLSDLAAALGIASRTRFLGDQPHEDVLRWMKAADLFLFASRTETQGMVVSEAMACGLPVVAVEAPGVDEAVRDGQTGRLVTPAALGAVADELMRDAHARARMASEAVVAASAFGRGAIADRLLALYRAVGKERSARR